MCGKKHRKTIGKQSESHRKNGENHCLWEISGPILMVLLSLYLSTYLKHPSLENHISSSQFLFDAIHFNRKRFGGQKPMPQSTCLDQSVYLLGRDISHFGPRIIVKHSCVAWIESALSYWLHHDYHSVVDDVNHVKSNKPHIFFFESHSFARSRTGCWDHFLWKITIQFDESHLKSCVFSSSQEYI
jgi:hypothetical protein